MAQYLVEEFLGKSEPTTLKKEVEKKIHILYELCILVRDKKTRDKREKALRKILLDCNSQTHMNNIVHDLIIGRNTLDSLLRRYNYVCN